MDNDQKDIMRSHFTHAMAYIIITCIKIANSSSLKRSRIERDKVIANYILYFIPSIINQEMCFLYDRYGHSDRCF